jgi:cyclopropane fatty-acyl-phospholipid synthase-like methyltransferase
MTTTRERGRRHADRDHYESLHRTSVDYQRKNWLLDDLPRLTMAGGTSIIEVGCGNGLFLERASRHWPDVIGVDWVRSAVLERVLADNPRIRFLQEDIVEFDTSRHFDLLVSADVLEHLCPSVLPTVIRRLHACGRHCYHKIACYDDGHSHLSVWRPHQWLRLFEESVPDGGYRIISRMYRGQRRKKPVVVISNME